MDFNHFKEINIGNRVGSNTEYVIALLPLGGYVKMAGIIDESMDSKLEHKSDEFQSKNLLEKVWVLSAGVLMNTLLAIVVFSMLGFYNGIPKTKNDPVVYEIQENMPAEEAGLMSGDRILSINSEGITTWKDMTKIIHSNPNSLLSFKNTAWD